MHSRFWLRLAKLGFILLLAYLLFAYTCLITIIIRTELGILDATKVITVFNQEEKGPCTLQGQVRNVFGDPVPFAVIVVAGRLGQADNTGVFTLQNLNPGRHTLEIFAGDYEKYAKEIQLETGLNSPPIKYETGLWPQAFLVDFHIFYKENDEILGIVGFANGTPDAIYIERATLLSPKGEVVTDILHDRDGFDYYANFSSKIEIVTKPQKALKWAGRTVQSGEFAPLQGNFRPGPYTLEVHYASAKGHEMGQYQVLVITDHLDLDRDWNPHIP